MRFIFVLLILLASTSAVYGQGCGLLTLNPITFQLDCTGPASSATGTVTSVSVVTANGVSGSVATATTTPAITLTLGAITPTTIVASGVGTLLNLKRGTGSPESAVTGVVGDIYQRTDGGTNTSVYRKEAGSGNTGWIAVSNAGTPCTTTSASLQFNSSGAFGCISSFTTNGTTTITGDSNANLDLSAAASVNLTAVFLRTDTASSDTAGIKRTHTASATTAPERVVGTADPSVLVGGDRWVSLAGIPKFYTGSATLGVVANTAGQDLTALSTGIMRVATSTGAVTALTTSAGIAANISDETGTGNLVFSADPVLTGIVTIGTAAAPTVSAAGQIAQDNNLWATGRGAIITYDGTAATALVATLVSDTPTNGQVPTWNTGGTITWETPVASLTNFTCSATPTTCVVYDSAGTSKLGVRLGATAADGDESFFIHAANDTALLSIQRQSNRMVINAENKTYLAFGVGGTDFFSVSGGDGFLRIPAAYGFCATVGSATTTADTCLHRNAAGVWEINDSNNATYRDLKLRTTIMAGTTPSTPSGCGTAIAGGNNAGTITSGTTGACTPVVTFAFTAPAGWACAIANQTTANLIRQTASTTTTATFSGTTVSGDVLVYHCHAY